jgi:hypothetical protein
VVPVLLLPWCQRNYWDPAFSVVHGVKVQVANNASISDYFNIFVDSEDFEGNQQICRALCSEKSQP